jgi:hypothetical protein
VVVAAACQGLVAGPGARDLKCCLGKPMALPPLESEAL